MFGQPTHDPGGLMAVHPFTINVQEDGSETVRRLPPELTEAFYIWAERSSDDG